MYRDDHSAALARIAELEQEVERLRAKLRRPSWSKRMRAWFARYFAHASISGPLTANKSGEREVTIYDDDGRAVLNVKTVDAGNVKVCRCSPGFDPLHDSCSDEMKAYGRGERPCPDCGGFRFRIPQPPPATVPR